MIKVMIKGAHKMDWTQTYTIIGAIIGAIVGMVAILCTLIIYTMNRLEGDIKTLDNRIGRLTSRLDGHASRIDQLYQMFVDLLKANK